MKITREQAIIELRAMIKHISDGYCCHLAHGGKTDNQIEIELDALQLAVDELDHPTEKGGVQEC